MLDEDGDKLTIESTSKFGSGVNGDSLEAIIFNPGECAGFMKGKNQIGIIDLNNLRPKVINF